MKCHKTLIMLILTTMLASATHVNTMSTAAENPNEKLTIKNTDIFPMMASLNWLPSPTKTVSNSSSFPITLSDGDVLKINGPLTYTAPAGKSPITLAPGATAKIIINGSVTLNGSNAEGMTGGTPAIDVPEGAMLTIYSAHDSELAESKNSPLDTLTLKGGNAASGQNGGDAQKFMDSYAGALGALNITTEFIAGSGGSGGGGAAPAIGGAGGNGASGPSEQKSPVRIVTNLMGTSYENQDDHLGEVGYAGNSGDQGQGCGKIYIAGRLYLNLESGSKGSSGTGGAGAAGDSETKDADKMIGGAAGGGGGGGGCIAATIGSGGAGGSSGGGGGLPGSDRKGNISGNGGGGGGGGWPSGGGGGGGATEFSASNDHNTGKGGSGGGDGLNGNDGIPSGTNHSEKEITPARGGKSGSNGSSGGKGGYFRKVEDDSYRGGNGGSGGNGVSVKSWHTPGNLIISTATNLRTVSSCGYKYGDGGGNGSTASMTPYVIYDLMDCKISTTLPTITYTGSEIKSPFTITYDSSSSRSGSTVNGNYTIPNNKYVITQFQNNIHAGKASATVVGADNANRANVISDKAVVGQQTVEFTIHKANLTTDIQKTISDNKGIFVYPNTSKSFTLSDYTSTTAGKGSLSNLLRESTQTEEGPKVKWEIVEGNGTITPGEGLTADFISSEIGKVKLRATLSDMNDFNDYVVEKDIEVIAEDWVPIDIDYLNYVPHVGIPIRPVSEDSDAGEVSYNWIVFGSEQNDSGSKSEAVYTPTKEDVGKTICVEIVPGANSPYMSESTYLFKNPVEDHTYENGFCTKCDMREAPERDFSGVYKIKNAGNLFWLAEKYYYNSPDIVESNDESIEVSIENDINLESSKHGQNALREGIIKNRNFPTLGLDRPFKGNFHGNYHTISDLYIERTLSGDNISNIGLIGNTYDASVDYLNVTGRINISGNGIASDIGSLIGYARGSDVSKSKIYRCNTTVNITNKNSNVNLTHVGGIVGNLNDNTLIEQCMNFGNIEVEHSMDCIAGIAAYNNTGIIKACSNHGVIKVYHSSDVFEDPYVGGILGYLNNKDGKVISCYNYGNISNESNSHCGGIIGWLRSHTAENLTNNYCLDTSAPSGFGIGSSETSAKAPTKTQAEFASGEVCYLLNDGSPYDPWTQFIDSEYAGIDETPNKYPAFDTYWIYHRSDGVYSNNQEYHEVQLTWDPLDFNYNEGNWDPNTHTYSGGWTSNDPDKNTVTVKNTSNVALNSEFTFTPDQYFASNYNLVGIFKALNSEKELVGKQRIESDSSLSAALNLKSLKPTFNSNFQNIGTATIKITTIKEV